MTDGSQTASLISEAYEPFEPFGGCSPTFNRMNIHRSSAVEGLELSKMSNPSFLGPGGRTSLVSFTFPAPSPDAFELEDHLSIDIEDHEEIKADHLRNTAATMSFEGVLRKGVKLPADIDAAQLAELDPQKVRESFARECHGLEHASLDELLRIVAVLGLPASFAGWIFINVTEKVLRDYISVREFLSAVYETLILEESGGIMNIKTAFSLYCLAEEGDRKRKISQTELAGILSQVAEQNKLPVGKKDITQMSNRIFDAAGANSSVGLPFEDIEKTAALGGSSNVLGEKIKADVRKEKAAFDLQTTWKFHKKRIWCMVVIMMLLLLCFAWGFAKHAETPEQQLMGWSLPMAKGCAQALKINLAVLILTVCKKLMAKVRESWISHAIPFDSAIALHKFLGVTALVFSLVHSIAHVVNIARATNPDNIDKWEAAMGNNTEQATVKDYVTSQVGITGVILCVLIFVAYPFALWVKLQNYFKGYSTFLGTHHLFYLFLLIVCIHPWPKFSFFNCVNVQGGDTLWWLFIPMLVLLYEKVMKERKRRAPEAVLQAFVHPGDILELRVAKPKGWRHCPGQYAHIYSGDISQEWHPFTLTSAPGDDYLSVHIKKAGDWTGELIRRVKEGKCPEVVSVEGPYGAPAQAYHKFQSVVLVGAGIGVTPFVAVAKDLLRRMERKDEEVPQRVKLIFATRDVNEISWLKETLQDLALTRSAAFDVAIYLTAAKKMDTAEAKLFMIGQDVVREKTGKDVVTGLTINTSFGRPAWQDIFSELSNSATESRIGVFTCAPPPLTAELQRVTTEYSSPKTKFVLKRELF